ncbi:ROK family protein [Shewanella cyperi]|uniref:N-acetylglucosamine kinase n=1 Tax=Shewanella cyperi TaxID=2814292 RepID=A0A974XMM0_9GAMM|nr:ROK family protein [Shewanella cyperi]QSX31207.1 ROK family protein [Shewanella cyperi]
MHYGLDIGGTKIALAIFDDELQCRDRWQLATPVDDYEAFLTTVCGQIALADERCRALASEQAQAEEHEQQQAMASVGIALPGVIQTDGTVLSSNVPCLNRRRVAEDLGARLGRKVATGNDCRCFTLSEALLGAGRDKRHVVGVILGTGLGGGLCIDGRLFNGANCLAGEFGHQGLAASVLLDHGLPLYDCGCGLRGCAENYVSGTGLGRLYRHFGGEADTYQWLAAYRDGEASAKRTFDAYVDALGSVLAGQILALDPDIFVFGGGLSQVPEIIEALPIATQKHLFAGVSLPDFRVAEFGAASGVRGAALLGKNQLLNESQLFNESRISKSNGPNSQASDAVNPPSKRSIANG